MRGRSELLGFVELGCIVQSVPNSKLFSPPPWTWDIGLLISTDLGLGEAMQHDLKPGLLGRSASHMRKPKVTQETLRAPGPGSSLHEPSPR